MTSETQTNSTMSMPVVENLAPNNHDDLHQDDVDARDREPRVQ